MNSIIILFGWSASWPASKRGRPTRTLQQTPPGCARGSRASRRRASSRIAAPPCNRTTSRFATRASPTPIRRQGQRVRTHGDGGPGPERKAPSSGAVAESARMAALREERTDSDCASPCGACGSACRRSGTASSRSADRRGMKGTATVAATKADEDQRRERKRMLQ
jgi:hypothetical protein